MKDFKLINGEDNHSIYYSSKSQSDYERTNNADDLITSYPMLFSSQVYMVSPILACEFTSYHRYCIENISYQNKQLFFPDNRWKSCLLGAGEEKAVFAVCDQDCNIFALELIDEKHYLNGRLIEGTYFLSTSVSQIRGIKFNPEAIIGLEFTGLVKARDFIRGYEWGRFQFSEKILHHICDILLTFYLQTSLYSDYNKFKTYYKDVHERNVMFELTNKKHKGIPMRIKNQNNQFEQVHIRLRGIDLR